MNESLDLDTKSQRRSVVLKNSIDYADKARILREEIRSLKSGLSIDTLILSQNGKGNQSLPRSPKKSFKQKRLKPQYVVINQDLDDSIWQYSGCEVAKIADFSLQSHAATTQCNDSNGYT